MARAFRTVQRAAAQESIPHRSSDSRWEAMIPVLDGDVPVVVQANDVRQIQDAVTWAEEEGVRLVILGGYDAPYLAEQLFEKGLPILLTGLLSAPQRSWEPYDGWDGLPARLRDRGVEFAIVGTPESAAYSHRLPYAAGAATAFGLTEAEALEAITLAPARILGIADRVGSLEVGKDATLIITTGSPLEYATEVEGAYIQGREVDLDHIHRQFYRKYRERLTGDSGPGS